jgi:hypothetical protein
MPWLVSRSSFTFAATMGLEKDGQPQPELNLADEANSGSPETIST